MWFNKFLELSNLIKDDDNRKEDILNYYYTHNNDRYIPHLNQSLKIVDYADDYKDYAFNIVKTTRAGCTTNVLLSALIRNKKILLVEPTNEILYETVREILSLYKQITGDDSKIVRQIPSNKDGCSQVVKKLNQNENMNLVPFLLSGECGNCKECEEFELNTTFIPKSTEEQCTIKTLMKECEIYGDDWQPDIVTITYDKLLTLGSGEKSDFFKDMIDRTDIVLFDEIGVFVSKMENGVPIYEQWSSKGETTIKSIKDVENQLWDFVLGLEHDGLKKRLASLVENYIIPFIDNTCLPAFNKNEYPSYVHNSLEEELVKVLVNYGNYKKYEYMRKREAIKDKAPNFFDDLETMIDTDDSESQELILWLIELLQIMQYEIFVAYEQTGLEVKNKEEIEYDSIRLVPMVNETFSRLEEYISDKTVLFTDATMPSFSFKNLNRHVIDIYFGDPVETNSKLMIMNDTKLPSFSVTRWNRDDEYREKIIDRIEHVAWFYGTDIVVWCPNKNIFKEVMKLLENREFSVCTHNNDDGSSILVTYFGSTMSRGVNSKRRIQILLGKANKPRGSFKHVAFMQRIQWDFFTERELQYIADDCNLSISKFKEKINQWMKEYRFGDKKLSMNKIPDELRKYFDHYANAIQKERTYMDTWQSGSRAKDSLAMQRSVLICLGWKNSEIWEMIKWGSNKIINYIPFFDNIQRNYQTQQSVIAPPRVIELNNEYDEIESWLDGGEVKTEYIGFDVDLQTGIYNMLAYKREYVESEEVWLELGKNLMIGENSEDCHNGYFVGSVKAFKNFNDFGRSVVCDEIDKGYFRFNINTDKEDKGYGELNINDVQIITTILKNAYIMDKEKVTFRDLRKNLKKSIDKDTLKKALFDIYRLDLLRNSTWVIKLVGKNYNFQIIKNVNKDKTLDERLNECSVDFKCDSFRYTIMRKIMDWYVNGQTLDISAKQVADDIGSSPKTVKSELEKMFKNKQKIMGLNCHLIRMDSGNSGSIKIIRTVAKPNFKK